MKKHLDLIGGLEDFSFLTVELAEQLFESKNNFLRPFGLESLVRTVDFKVLKRLLAMWNFDLRGLDAKLIIAHWNLEDLLEEDPRYWLIYRKAEVNLSEKLHFPMDKLIEKLTIETLESHINLILAFVYDSEMIINQMMNYLEFSYADLHKNDEIEERYMSPKMIEELDSRKWGIWLENGNFAIEVIKNQMNLKKKLIEKLSKMDEEIPKYQMVNKHIALLNLLTLLKTPLNSLARSSFIKSRNREKVVSAVNNFKFINSGYTEIVHFCNLRNEHYWVYLWKQLEIFGVEIVYEIVEEGGDHKRLILETSLLLHRYVYKQIPNSYWHSQIAFFTVVDGYVNFEDSEILVKILFNLMENQICELSGDQISILKTGLHPEISKETKDLLELIENDDHNLEVYRLAPETLTREQVKELFNNPETRKLMKYSIENVNRLRFLDSFNADNFAASQFLKSC